MLLPLLFLVAQALPEVGLQVTSNSGFPSAQEDGPVWAGRGVTVSVTPRQTLAKGRITVTVAPVLWWTQNAPVSSIPAAGTAPNDFVDPMRPNSIDLPQRFGNGPVARLDWGETTVAVQRFGVRAAFTSAARHLGSGGRHALLMSGDAPGFPRVELGTSAPWHTPIGDFATTLSAGQIGQTRWAPEERTGSRSGSFFEARWRPFADSSLELGGARFYHRDWEGARLGDLAIPFGSLFFDAQTFGGGEADNQLIAVYGTLRMASAGLELFAEFGLNDRQEDFRGFLVEAEHNSSWLVGFRRRWDAEAGARWSFDATAVSGKIPPIQRFRGQATFYQHSPVRQGHTNRGQLLGTRLLERTGGAELRLERATDDDLVRVTLGTRDLQQRQVLSVPEPRLRREWSVIAETSHRHSSHWELFTRAGLIADLNRHPTFGDAYSVVLATGLTWRP